MNCKSNHPPHVVRNIPKGIEWRLSSISSNEEVFYANKAQYNAALAAAGYKEEIKYRPEILETIKKGEQKQKKKDKAHNILQPTLQYATGNQPII